MQRRIGICTVNSETLGDDFDKVKKKKKKKSVPTYSHIWLFAGLGKGLQ